MSRAQAARRAGVGLGAERALATELLSNNAAERELRAEQLKRELNSDDNHNLLFRFNHFNLKSQCFEGTKFQGLGSTFTKTIRLLSKRF
jgi:hypothetical protein